MEIRFPQRVFNKIIKNKGKDSLAFFVIKCVEYYTNKLEKGEISE